MASTRPGRRSVTLPVMPFTVRIDEENVCMRVDDARHSKVLPNRLSTALILRLHLGFYLQTVDLVSPINSILIGFDGLVLSGIKTNIDRNRSRLFSNL